MIKRSMSTTWPFRFSPTFAVAYNNRGVAYLSQKRLEKALEDFNKALALNSTYVDAYKNRGYFIRGQRTL